MCSLVHIRKILDHARRREKGHGLNAYRSQNMCLKVLLEGHSCDAFYENPSPVHAHSVLELCSWLVDERPMEYVSFMSRKVVKTDGTRPLVELEVFKCISETGYVASASLFAYSIATQSRYRRGLHTRVV